MTEEPLMTLVVAPKQEETVNQNIPFTPYVVFGASKSGTTWIQRILDGHPQSRCHFQRMIFPCVTLRGLLSPVTLLYNKQHSPFGGVFENDASEECYNLEQHYLEKMDILLPDYLARKHSDWTAEQRLVMEPMHAETVRQLVAGILQDVPGKTHYGTKAHIEMSQLLSFFPKAKVVHIVRDGRDVVVSKRFHTNRAGAYYRGDEKGLLCRLISSTPFGVRVMRATQRRFNWFGDNWFQQPTDRARLFTAHILRKFTLDWVRTTRYILSFQERFPNNVMMIKYEDLLQDGPAQISRVFSHLDLSDDPKLVADLMDATSFKKSPKDGFWRKGVSGDWTNHFSHEDKQLFNELADDLLQELDYEDSTQWVDRD